MGKFYGPVGYVKMVEPKPGVWVEEVTEVNYTGDVLKVTGLWRASENLNDDLTVNNVISVIADPYAYENFQSIRYIKWMGAYWKINNIEVQRPRLILTVGGVYNGNTSTTTVTP